jgi:rhamnose utilization protein RhaD (predicted bifunctional aldolase and dehydrogenase)/NAD(P)-dependent dehydrogenase (short-subunit alcohol dehydrogenase family)
MMNKNIENLITISHFYGNNKDYVIAGGGNTSYKDENHLWVKASGTMLATITEDGFAILDRSMLNDMAEKVYNEDSSTREAQVKEDLFKAAVYPEKNLRPSVESSLHNIIPFKFVVHTHPTKANAVLCSVNSEKVINELFGNTALYVSYTDPGYVLFKKVDNELKKFTATSGQTPHILFLENHGVFVSADSIEEIKDIYRLIDEKIDNKIKAQPATSNIMVNAKTSTIIPALRMMVSEDTVKILRVRNSALIEAYSQNEGQFSKISQPFTPDIIVYCKSKFIYIDGTKESETILDECQNKIAAFRDKYGYNPKIILMKGIGLIGIEDTSVNADIILDVYEDLMKISSLSENFGGPHFLDTKEIAFIENWEVENYRRKVSMAAGNSKKIENKIIVVTGGAQGFGGGLAEQLHDEGANIVIADLNAQTGTEMQEKLNHKGKKNTAYFVKTDVSSPESVQHLVDETVKQFGGLDVFISNAGILKAGGLDDIDPATFELITKVNYTGYFLCAKFASKVMKLQWKYRKSNYCDIIQINSKSGLKGSNKNFAYAGGKFGGIGLTQSFALELMPFNIKVNSVCPGNFLDGPLWSDPEKGLFVQYLHAGKVPGAKTVEDVKNHYEKQVPAGRGCRVEDVTKAVLYIIDQEYETGQALPVTGGQEMLN